MGITADQKYILDHQAGAAAAKAGLGTLIENAETATGLTMADGTVLIGNASNVGTAVTLTGDVTTTNAGVTAIGATKVTTAMMANLADGTILVGNGSNRPTAVTLSGDVTTTNAGVTAIGAAKVTVAMCAAAVMKEATGTLTQAQLLAISTPVTLIAAGAAGTVHIVDEIELFHDYATAAYATGADLQFEYATSGDNIALVDSTFVTGGADQNVIIKPSTYGLDGSTGTGVGFDVTANAAKAVQVTGSNFTNGNASNIVKYRVRYHTVTLLT